MKEAVALGGYDMGNTGGTLIAIADSIRGSMGGTSGKEKRRGEREKRRKEREGGTKERRKEIGERERECVCVRERRHYW